MPSTRYESRARPVFARLLSYVCISAALASPVLGQQSTVQGRVHDGDGAAVSGVIVTIQVDSAVVAGASTDRLGSFRLPPIPGGPYALHVRGLGYASYVEAITVPNESTLDLEVTLLRQALVLEGVSVEAAASRRRAQFEELAGATIANIDVAGIRSVPGIAEADPIRAVEVLPGVVSTSDFSASFHVRGGSQDQNLILLDGVPIFSPFHLGGLFSVFNADMLDRVQLQSGGFGAEHGGRVSSVLEIESDPGEGPFRVDAGISLLASRAAAGGPAPRAWSDGLGLSSLRYRVSARRSYFDVLAKPWLEFPYHLTDFQLAVEGWTASGSRLALTAYSGRDVLALTDVEDDGFPLKADWDWGNDLVGLRWTRPRAGGGSLDLLANFSRYGTGLRFPEFDDTEFESRIQQAQVRAALDLRPTTSLSVQLGASVERLAYENLFATGGTVFGDAAGTGSQWSTYAQVRWSRPREWLVEAGARFDGWTPDPGPSVAEVSPRLAVKRFFLDGDLAIKAAAGRYTQFLHSIRDEELPLGLDIWILAGEQAPHITSDQVQFGLEGYRGADWFWSVEGYLRDFDGVVTLNSSDDTNDRQDDYLPGNGLSYGLDVLVRKDTGDVTGWASLSLLRAERTFSDPLAPGRPDVTYPPIFDRRLDFDLVLQFPFPWGWDAGLRWNLGTGIPYTRAVGSFVYYTPRWLGSGSLEWTGDGDGPEGSYAVLLGERNGDRYPLYHRLDLNLRRTSARSWGTLTPYISLVNVYNQVNPLFYFYEYDANPPVRTGVTMFPVLPTVGLEVTF